MANTETGIQAAGEELTRGVLEGNFKSVARLITLVENGAPASTAFLSRLFIHAGRCLTIGVTGASGAGKSTLVDLLLGYYRTKGHRVGVLAVDPTSPYSGGAILGDRIRMQSRALDSGAFIRSMATRGHLGGLAGATADALLVLDAAGFDTVLIETVGVGQDEIEIARTADVTLVLLVPGMGDDIQAMKAGIMEIGDIFVVNKSERPGADRLETETRALVAAGRRADGWRPEVVRTIASEGAGLEKCVEAIERYRGFLASSEFRRDRSMRLQRERLIEMVRSRVLADLTSRPECAAQVDELSRRIAVRDIDPFSAAEELLRSYCRQESREAR